MIIDLCANGHWYGCGWPTSGRHIGVGQSSHEERITMSSTATAARPPAGATGTTPSAGRAGLDRAATGSRVDEAVTRRLLDSAAALSYDPAEEVDWDAPVPDDKYGLNPEWSSLFGTPLWDEMTFDQKITLTKHEVASIMSIGIWFEMILQQMVLLDQYVSNYAPGDFSSRSPRSPTSADTPSCSPAPA